MVDKTKLFLLLRGAWTGIVVVFVAQKLRGEVITVLVVAHVVGVPHFLLLVDHHLLVLIRRILIIV